jgi:hypothetical protein
LAGKEIPASRLGPKGEWLNYGGDKLWPAPQGRGSEEEWPGPPDAVLDGGSFTAKVTKEGGRPVGIEMRSPKDKQSGVQFSRSFKIFEDSTRVKVAATMKNIDTKPRRWGIWAVTQFDTSNRDREGYNPNYRVYCPINPNSMFYRGYNVMLGLTSHLSYKPDYEKGMMRVKYEHRVGKIGMDSSAGWVATLDGTEGCVFVHRFTYEPGMEYPDDASVEVWMNGLGELVAWKNEVIGMPESLKDNPYALESEILSPYAALAPGESYTFEYDWYAAKVPAGSGVAWCNDIGVICKPLEARLGGGRLILAGDYGVFYKGYIRVGLLDWSGRQIKDISGKVEVTPLEAVVISKIVKAVEGSSIPEDAAEAAIYIYSPKGELLGELDRCRILGD